MNEDRLEIKSPGRLPNIVTVDNIFTTRFARNLLALGPVVKSLCKLCPDGPEVLP